ncbi:MAG: hypothetical protein ACM3XM_19140, partial [Mycobacterium leprae]
MSTTWFDLASPRRQRLSVTGRPADALFAATVAFGPGECPSSDGLVLADTSAVPFAVERPTYHPDGSLAHCTIRWADRESLNPGADRLLALYYGGPPQPGGNDLMAWEEAARAIRTPVYTAAFDEAGRLGSLVLTGVGQEMLGEGGLRPAICLPGGSGWLGLEPGGEPVVSVTPAAVVAEVRYRWEGIHATCRFTFLPTHIRVTYETAGLPDGAALLPLAARLRQHAGYLIGPGDWRGPLNQSGQTVDRQGPLTLPGFHLSSQSGLVCLVNGADRPCDRFVYDDTCPSGALVGVGYSRAGAAAGEVLLIPTPFNGAATLEHAGRLAERFGGAGPTASVVPGAAEVRPAALHVQAGDGLRLEAGPLTLGAAPAGDAFRLELSAAGRPLMTTDRLYRLDTPGGQAAAAPHFASMAGETLLLAAELTDREGN